MQGEEVEDGLWADSPIQAFTVRLPNGRMDDGVERVIRVNGLRLEEARAINRAFREMEGEPGVNKIPSGVYEVARENCQLKDEVKKLEAQVATLEAQVRIAEEMGRIRGSYCSHIGHVTLENDLEDARGRIKQLEACLKGVASCSTCGACREAAKRTLGEKR